MSVNDPARVLERPKTARAQKKAETRRALKRAALECFATAGYRQTQVGDISRRAGVAHGTFYVHFETKEALIDELVIEFNTALLTKLERAFAKQEPAGPRGIATRLAEICLDHWKSERELLAALAERVGVGASLPALRDGISPPLVPFLAERLRAAALLKGTELADAELVAHALLGMWTRIGLQYLFGSNPSRKRAVELLVELSLGAIGAVLPGLMEES
jgi:AcrR family transcriptional regulator